nr:MAG TPA: hypothetical protein [Caudoviricetes sp.]
MKREGAIASFLPFACGGKGLFDSAVWLVCQRFFYW